MLTGSVGGAIGVQVEKIIVAVGLGVIVLVFVGRGVCVIVAVGGIALAVCVKAASAVLTITVSRGSEGSPAKGD